MNFSFKKFLENVQDSFPQPVSIFGKTVNTVSEFDKVAIEKYKSMGYTDEQIDLMMKRVSSDDLLNNDNLPSVIKRDWIFYDSPYYSRVWNLLSDIIVDELKKEAKGNGVLFAYKVTLFKKAIVDLLITSFEKNDGIAVNPYTKIYNMYKNLHKKNINHQEIKRFFDDLYNSGILHKFIDKIESLPPKEEAFMPEDLTSPNVKRILNYSSDTSF